MFHPTQSRASAHISIREYRICPGRHFAESAMFINLASALHVFNFSPPLDKDGREIKIKPEQTDGLLS